MLFLFSFLLFSPPLPSNQEAFKHFKKIGTEPYCLVDYKKKEVRCLYKNMDACRNEYVNTPVAVCFERKQLKLGDER